MPMWDGGINAPKNGTWQGRLGSFNTACKGLHGTTR